MIKIWRKIKKLEIQKYKTIIIGGGPAGIAAGLTLLKNKEECCIIEKETFPRLKLCGGLLTQKTVETIQKLGLSLKESNIPYYQTSAFDILDNGVQKISVNCDDNFILVDRPCLDTELARLFKQQGGIIKEGEKVNSIDLDNHTVSSDNATYKYENLICADGLSGISKKYIKNKKMEKAFCLEISIPIQSQKEKEAVKLDTGIFKKGYAWIFPKSDSICIGMGGTNYKEEDYIEKFKNYFSDYQKEMENIKLKGAFLPFGKCDKIVCQKHGNLFLVGDTAGFIDTVTGEGIYYALESGIKAAQSIIEGRGDIDKSLQYYRNKTKKFIKITNRSNKIANMFYKNKNMFYKISKEHYNFFKYFCEVQILKNKYDYNIMKIFFSYKANKKRV